MFRLLVALGLLVFLLLGCQFVNFLWSGSTGESSEATLPTSPTLLAPTAFLIQPSPVAPNLLLEPTQSLSQEELTAETAPTSAAVVSPAAGGNAAAQATAQAQPLVDYIATLIELGYLNAADGRYYRLADFDQSLARMSEWALFTSGHSPKNFVLRTNVAWESASDKANWDWTGCGFAFRRNQSSGDYYAVQLGLDGSVHAWNEVDGVLKLATPLFSQRYSLEVPRGTAELVVIVENAHVTVLVNDSLVFRDYESLLNIKLASGELAYLIRSGSNAGFGTRCMMTNVQLWEFIR